MENEKKTISEKILQSIGNLKERKSKFLFCIPNTTQPSALVYEIYFHMNVVKNLGFNVIGLNEDSNQNMPEFIETSLISDIEHMSIDSVKLKISPEDFLIIPEMFTNIMEQTKKLTCKRIVLLQSIDFMYNSLVPGVNWKNFGISDVITTSSTLKNIIENIYDTDYFKIKTYTVGIPDYFNNAPKLKRPVISIIGRNTNDITKIVKMFYSKYPQFNWILFDAMITNKKPPQPLSRPDFAKRLSENFAAIWVDRISSFGTFPLECMRVGTIPICFKPDITPPYVHDDEGKVLNNIGYWTNNFYEIPNIIGDVVTKFLDDSIEKTLIDGMYDISQKYTSEISKESLTAVYMEYIDERITLLENTLNKQ